MKKRIRTRKGMTEKDLELFKKAIKESEVQGLIPTNNPRLFLDKKGSLYSVEFNQHTGTHYLSKLSLGRFHE